MSGAISMDDPICYLNGKWLPLSQARISPLDRGFIFGDGVYEVVPVYRRKPFRLEQHLARLERSLREVRIVNPFNRTGWQALLARLIERGGAEDQYVYLQVTRGVARRDFAFPTGVPPTVFAMTTPFVRPGPELREGGLRAVTRADERWLRCDIKSVSLLAAVLARQYAVENDAHEVVQFRDGWLTEGSASNIWVVKAGAVHGPPRDQRILEGIRYGLLQELCAQEGIAFAEQPLARAAVEDADELLLTAATREILPIVQLDGRPVGDGRPGPIYRRLRAAYDRAIEAL
ncbi:MAG: D-amino acid aminotransferase [Burkholderiaceae bacterium]|nr:D-amino acid aminotransferase [Burkholderiaceae bacterium]